MATKNESSKDTGHSFADYFKRAASPMLVLHLLTDGPMYVYQMAQELNRRSDGAYTMSLLYPVMYRLVKLGYVAEGEKQVSEDNRVRQYYTITPAGQEYLSGILTEYDRLVFAVHKIITCPKELQHDDESK